MRRILMKLSLVYLLMIFSVGCDSSFTMSRDELLSTLPVVCKNRYQAYITCRGVDNTLWVYLPYSQGRRGQAETKIEDNNAFYLEYKIASFNPFKKIEPPELKYIAQKVVREIRNFELRCKQPYTFFVLVVTNVENPANGVDEYYMGYFDDIKNHKVGVDFSGEGFSRLAWDQVDIEQKVDADGNKSSASFQDVKGDHVNYHDLTMREFVEKQIKWRVYKRFSLEYSTTAFDLTAQEKESAVINIVKTVITAYNFNEMEKFFLKDASFLEEQKYYQEHPSPEIKQYKAEEVMRKAAF